MDHSEFFMTLTAVSFLAHSLENICKYATQLNLDLTSDNVYEYYVVHYMNNTISTRNVKAF